MATILKLWKLQNKGMEMRRLFASLAFVCSVLMLSGCVNTPTETAGVKDDRPYIMFDGVASNDMIVLDGIGMGKASDFISGKSALRIEPGTHMVQIRRNDEVVLEQKFYIARGSSKSFTIHSK